MTKNVRPHCHDILTALSVVPALDTFTNLASIPVDIAKGDWLSAGLDLFGAIPFVGEVADTAKLGLKAGKVLDKASDGAKVFDNIADGAKVFDNTANVSRIVKKADDISGAIEIVDKTKGANVAANLPDVDMLSKRTLEIAQNAPIKIPQNADVIIEKKTTYTQMKYVWYDGMYKYQGRWHTRTPKAPKEQGVTWVIERKITGQGYGEYARQGVKEVMVGIDEWIPEGVWRDARNARGLGTITKKQEGWLDAGHFKDNTKL